MSNRSPDRGLRALPGRACALLLAVLFVAFSGTVLALPDDREQPIRITADQALRDEKQGFTEYTGNVRMDQGSLHIEADKITKLTKSPSITSRKRQTKSSLKVRRHTCSNDPSWTRA